MVRKQKRTGSIFDFAKLRPTGLTNYKKGSMRRAKSSKSKRGLTMVEYSRTAKGKFIPSKKTKLF